jgi:hypothetical protein
LFAWDYTRAGLILDNNPDEFLVWATAIYMDEESYPTKIVKVEMLLSPECAVSSQQLYVFGLHSKVNKPFHLSPEIFKGKNKVENTQNSKQKSVFLGSATSTSRSVRRLSFHLALCLYSLHSHHITKCSFKLTEFSACDPNVPTLPISILIHNPVLSLQ